MKKNDLFLHRLRCSLVLAFSAAAITVATAAQTPPVIAADIDGATPPYRMEAALPFQASTDILSSTGALDSVLSGMARNANTGSSDSTKSATFRASNLLMNKGMVPIVAAAQPGQVLSLKASAEALGMVNVTVAEGAIYGRIAPSKMAALGALGSLRFARYAGQSKNNVGSVTSQGDVSMKSNVARQRTTLNGAGVKVGILSDSYNALGTAGAGVSSGNLPGAGNPNGFSKPVRVLRDAAAGTDEGRAMAEIVHDVAPGAELSFYAVSDTSEAGFADGIRALAADGAKVIVDDVGFFAEPHFQDGLVARAVDQVAAQGVAYFSSAGNQAREAYEAQAFLGAPVKIKLPDGTVIGEYLPHQVFTDDFHVTPFLRVNLVKTAPGPQLFVPFMQWSEPWASLSETSPGTKTDWDLFIFSEPNFDSLIAAGTGADIGRDPIEVAVAQADGPVGARFSVYVAMMAPISRVGAPSPGYGNYRAAANRLRMYFPYPGFALIDTNAEPAGTIVGHANAAGAIALCAASYNDIDADGRYIPEDFTSVGGVVVRVSANGFPTYQDRQKPDLCGPDNANTSFFSPGGLYDPDRDGFPNFAGTSASAPHVAAVGALLKQARPDFSPNQIRHVLKATARDMIDPYNPYDFGPDRTTGAGFVDADRALRAIGR